MQFEVVALIRDAVRRVTSLELDHWLAWDIVRMAGGRHGGLLKPAAEVEVLFNIKGARRGRGSLTKTRIRRECRFR